MAKFVVDRRTWYRGKGSDESKLLRDDGMRCCIGFVGQQCGIEDEYLLDKPDISSTLGSFDGDEKWPAWMRGTQRCVSVPVVSDAYSTNDSVDSYVSDAAREARLKQIFAAHGDEIVFEN